MDIVSDYRAARARLRLAPYDAWLVEWISRRVARLLDKCDQLEHAGDDQGDVAAAGGSEAAAAVPRALACERPAQR
ncbi:MAG: hypothetical protein HUU20_13880 [Pirellulales bacterium]|nr:hypothetical protein [Pirellulales bacterium]